MHYETLGAVKCQLKNAQAHYATSCTTQLKLLLGQMLTAKAVQEVTNHAVSVINNLNRHATSLAHRDTSELDRSMRHDEGKVQLDSTLKSWQMKLHPSQL
jgi:endonuclease III